MVNPSSPSADKKPFIKEYWYVPLFALFPIALLLSFIFRILTPKVDVPLQENTWQGITPGYSKLTDVTQKMGEPIEQTQTAKGTAYQYESTYVNSNNQVVADTTGTVVFIKEFIDYKKAPKLNEFTDKYGPYDFKLKDTETGSAVNAYVFLDEGVVILAHIANNTVEQKWYFEPVSKEIFLKSWGVTLAPAGSEHVPAPSK